MQLFKSDADETWGIQDRGGIVYEPTFTWQEAWRVMWAHLLGARDYEDTEAFLRRTRWTQRQNGLSRSPWEKIGNNR